MAIAESGLSMRKDTTVAEIRTRINRIGGVSQNNERAIAFWRPSRRSVGHSEDTAGEQPSVGEKRSAFRMGARKITKDRRYWLWVFAFVVVSLVFGPVEGAPSRNSPDNRNLNTVFRQKRDFFFSRLVSVARCRCFALTF